jgi:predicted RNA-binding Zn-ribbon protein involved in translation (DUF1610 family)
MTDGSLLDGKTPLMDDRVLESGEFTIELSCVECAENERFSSTVCRNCATELTHRMAKGSDWRQVQLTVSQEQSDDGEADVFPALCPKCGNEYVERAKDQARAKGTVPCRRLKHSSHEVGSEAFDSCLGNYIPLTEEDVSAVREAWLSVRDSVCPDCSAPKAALDRVETARIPMMNCDCGWSGPPVELTRVKQ